MDTQLHAASAGICVAAAVLDTAFLGAASLATAAALSLKQLVQGLPKELRGLAKEVGKEMQTRVKNAHATPET